MKKLFLFTLRMGIFAGIVTLLGGCGSAKDVLYLQDVTTGERQQIVHADPLIQPGDILSITVNSKNPELAAPFNLPMVSYTGASPRGMGIQYLQGHLVNNDGSITFPLLGKINAAGLTKQQLTDKIARELIAGNYLQDPIITITYQNFKISVLGEVNKPGSFSVDNERISLLDAIGMAGDMTIYGRRDNVTIVREIDGVRTIFVQDLRSKEFFTSPCYYLMQNDVVIVHPNNIRVQMSGINQNNNVGVWLSVISSATSVATLVMTVTTLNNSTKNK